MHTKPQILLLRPGLLREMARPGGKSLRVRFESDFPKVTLLNLTLGLIRKV